jgi:hypothetical protein
VRSLTSVVENRINKVERNFIAFIQRFQFLSMLGNVFVNDLRLKASPILTREEWIASVNHASFKFKACEKR